MPARSPPCRCAAPRGEARAVESRPGVAIVLLKTYSSLSDRPWPARSCIFVTSFFFRLFLARRHIEIIRSETAGAIGVKDERCAVAGQRRRSVVVRAVEYWTQVLRR